MRKLALVAVLAMLLVGTASVASADVMRRPSGADISAVVLGTYHHTYSVTAYECRGGYWRYEGTGAVPGYTETITGWGRFSDMHQHWEATYNTGYTWTFDGDLTGFVPPDTFRFTGTGHDSLGQTFPVTVELTHTYGEYRNHGEVVKAAGGGADAAHDCLGMPAWAMGH